MKASKIRRKQLNELRGMQDIPWPARAHKIPPTFGRAAKKEFHIGTCERVVGETTVSTKKGRFRRKRTETVEVPCGGRLIAKLGSLGKRRVYCENCRARRREEQRIKRLEEKFSKFGRNVQREEAQTSRRTLLSLFRRGSR